MLHAHKELVSILAMDCRVALRLDLRKDVNVRMNILQVALCIQP
jgi:hypothetical protein